MSDNPDEGAKQYPVTTITSIEYFDEDTADWVTIFTGSDTVSNSVLITTTDFRITLYNGYSFESGKRYKITYKYTNAAPDEVKTIAIEQAARYFLNSPEGQAWFSKSSENIGSQASESVGIESQDVMTKRHYDILSKHREFNIG